MPTLTEQQIDKMLENPDNLADLEIVYGEEDVNWIADNCWIINKKGEKVRLVANSAQKKLQRVIEWFRARGKPIRIIILKARQEGVTTWIQAWIFAQCNKKSNRAAMTAAHKNDASVSIFDKIQMFQANMVRPLPTVYSNRKEIVYRDPHGSKTQVSTAGDEDLGRALWFLYFHGSEAAFWENAKKTLLSALQCIPKNVADTASFLESTANGLGGEFCNRWWDAVNGVSDYYPLFLAWHTFEEYQSDVPVGFARTEYEIELAELYDLTDRQLQWRREVIKNDCGGDEKQFCQEYPSNDEEAFLVSGRPVFPQGPLQKAAKRCTAPKAVGRLVCPDNDYTKVEFVEDVNGPLEIWEWPANDRLYGIGADTAEGKDPEESNDPDSSSAHVGDVALKRVVAKLSGLLDMDLYGEQLGLLAYFYGKKEIGIDKQVIITSCIVGNEINNTSGGVILTILKRMGVHIYMQRVWNRYEEKWKQNLGWKTDMITREVLVSSGVSAVRDELIDIPSSQTIHQMRMWVRDKLGKATHPPGEHDDDVISLLIMLQMMIHVAGHESLENYTKHEDAEKPRYNKEGVFNANDLARVGAVDTFEDMEDDE